MTIYRSKPAETRHIDYTQLLDELELDIIRDIAADCFLETADGLLRLISKDELVNNVKTRMICFSHN